MSKKIKCHSPQLDTALHVVKGAIVKVLHTPLTISVSYRNAKQARINVEYTSETGPTNDQLKEIENLSNELIKKNITVTDTVVSKEDAEAKFSTAIPNTSLFDKFLPKIDQVNVVLIENWNVNCCAGPHLPNTGEIGELSIIRANFRPQKKECEFVVQLGENKANIKETKKNKWESKKKQVKQEDKPIQPLNNQEICQLTNVNLVTDDILKLILKEVGIDDSKVNEIESKLQPTIRQKLTLLKNHSYAQGYRAGKQ